MLLLWKAQFPSLVEFCTFTCNPTCEWCEGRSSTLLDVLTEIAVHSCETYYNYMSSSSVHNMNDAVRVILNPSSTFKQNVVYCSKLNRVASLIALHYTVIEKGMGSCNPSINFTSDGTHCIHEHSAMSSPVALLSNVLRILFPVVWSWSYLQLSPELHDWWHKVQGNSSPLDNMLWISFLL